MSEIIPERRDEREMLRDRGAVTPPDIHDPAVSALRFLAVDAVNAAKSGHPGTPLDLAPVIYRLFALYLRHDPAFPDWPDRDRFVLSSGHASMVLYGALHLAGYGISMDDLRSFRQLGSPCAGHPERGLAPGIEVTTGPLGQGVVNAVGLAIAEKLMAARFNRSGSDVIDQVVDYDYLVIALGSRLAYDKIEGFGEHGDTVSSGYYGNRLRRRLASYKGGPIAIGSARFHQGLQGKPPWLPVGLAACEGPPLELGLGVANWLHEHHHGDAHLVTLFRLS